MHADTPEPPPRRKWHLQRWLIVLVAAMLAYGAWTEYAFRSALKQAKALAWTVEYTDPVEKIRANWKKAFEKETWLQGVKFVAILDSEYFEQHLNTVHRLNPKALTIYNALAFRDLSALNGLTRLKQLDIRAGLNITNVDGLKNLPALNTLRLVGCPAPFNVDALKNVSALKTVDLSWCEALTNVDALKNLTALEFLDLNGCIALTNVDALKGLAALERLSLNECKGLTNVDGLKNLTALERVSLVGCTGLTKEQITALKAALPKTRITSDY